MAQVFVSYAAPDRDTALPIIDALGSAGLEVMHPEMISSGAPYAEQFEREVEAAQCVILLWSQAAANSELVQGQIRQAIQAWSSERLVLATLDDTPLPLGLRDIPTIAILDGPTASASKVIARAKSIVGKRGRARRPTRRRFLGPIFIIGARVIAVTMSLSLSLVGAVVVAVVFFDTKAPTITKLAPGWENPVRVPRQATDGRPPSLREQPSPSPFVPTSSDWQLPVLGVTLALILFLGAVTGAGVVWVWTARLRRRWKRAAELMPQIPSDGLRPVFVSYSREDARKVEALVQQIEQSGYAVWIDRHSVGPQRYAAQIVQAIRGARLVALMCSRNAFASDHVIREVYVAGDYKKPFIAFQLDPTEFPDDIVYFLSGFPRLSITSIDPQILGSEITRLVVAAIGNIPHGDFTHSTASAAAQLARRQSSP